MAEVTAEQVRDEVRQWLSENWSDDLTVAEWWDRLARSGYAAPTFPTTHLGRGYGRALANVVNEEIHEGRRDRPAVRSRLPLAAPTIAAHGNERAEGVIAPHPQRSGQRGASCSPSLVREATSPGCSAGPSATARSSW